MKRWQRRVLSLLIAAGYILSGIGMDLDIRGGSLQTCLAGDLPIQSGKEEADNGDYYDEDGTYRYTYWSGSPYLVRINSTNLDWFVSSGRFEELIAEHNADVYVDIVVRGEGHVIPKDFLNMLATENGECYMFIRDGDAIYDWGIQTNKTFHATRDFSPYITFSVPEELAEKYPEGTTYVQMQTDFMPETFGVGQSLSLTQIMIDGTLYKSSDFFKNFFATYNVEGCQVDLGDCYRYGYRDYNYNWSKGRQYKGDIGYFQITEFGEDAVIQNWQECVWDYYDFKVEKYNTYATVEMKRLAGLSGGTFVLSDQKPIVEETPGTMIPEPSEPGTFSGMDAPVTSGPAVTSLTTEEPEETEPYATTTSPRGPDEDATSQETSQPEISESEQKILESPVPIVRMHQSYQMRGNMGRSLPEE